MIYKDFQNLRLPMLGFGSMRLPLLPGGGDGDVDEAAVAEMVALAMERGANYFDTAYGYHNGNSERVMGRVLSRYPRESWLLASKFPGYDVSNIRPDRVEAIFEEQLEKCGVDYFDFYLFHNVYERNVGPYLDPDNRVLEYLLRQKEAGRIRHLGFSAHGSLAVIQRFLDAYGEYMEFGQLQLNYLDWDFQGTRAKAEELNRRHIPIWVMEPLRGGRLARLSDGDAARLAVLRPEESMPGWAFRFLQGVPGVTMVLSGMSSLEQLRANLDTFETDRPLSEAEKAALLDVAARGRRKFVLVHFSTDIKTDLFEPGHYQTADILRAAEHFFNGGTNFERPLKEAMRLLENGFENTDITIITDGESELTDAFTKEFRETLRRQRAAMTGILLDKDNACGKSLEPFCDRIFRTKELTEDDIAVQLLNRKVS